MGLGYAARGTGVACTIAVMIVLAAPVALFAFTPISQSYISEQELAVGSIVSLRNDASDTIEAASRKNVDNTLGVVVYEDTSPISLTSGESSQVQIATAGTAAVLVSDINGKVARGDHITASPIDGVGMKATSNTKVVGIAQSDPKYAGGSQQTYKDADGQEQKLALGQVPVQVNVAYYFKDPDKSIIPASFQKIANSIAGKPVKPLPIIISGVIFIITLMVVASIIYSMIRSSIIATGRNPMSQGAIYRDVIQLSALVLGILAVAVIAIYLILTRL